MAADDENFTEEAGEAAVETTRGAKNVATTVTVEVDFWIIVISLASLAALVLAFVYYRSTIASYGTSLVGGPIGVLTQLFNGIGSAIAAAFARLDHWLNPGGYAGVISAARAMMVY